MPEGSAQWPVWWGIGLAWSTLPLAWLAHCQHIYGSAPAGDPAMTAPAISIACISEAKGEFDVFLGEVLVGRLRAATATLITRGDSCNDSDKQRVMRVMRQLLPRLQAL